MDVEEIYCAGLPVSNGWRCEKYCTRNHFQPSNLRNLFSVLASHRLQSSSGKSTNSIMRVKAFNHIHLARFFLIGLGLVGIYTAWSGILPDKMTLVPCLFHLITDISCPGCGITRACVSLAQGKFTAAWGYHPFVFFLVPLALGISCAPTRLRDTWLKLRPPVRNSITGMGIALVLGLWIYRLTYLAL